MDIEEQLAVIQRGAAEIIHIEEIEKKLRSGKVLRVKVGFDPTAPDIHLGHTVLLHKMRHLQMMGHTIIFLIGDFTARIGDPSGRNVTRPPLSEEEIAHNAKTYTDQVFKILDEEKTIVEYNSRWSDKLSSSDLIKLMAQCTVARMLEREDFKNRYTNEIPISIHEFLYPLLQGYDSVALQSDIELGGTDQKFNLLMGRTLQTHYGQTPQSIITMPLLEGLDGVHKMSKSFGNYIGVQESPRDMFGKILSISDELMWRYYELLSLKSMSAIAEYKQSVEDGRMHPKAVKEELALEIVERFHSKEEALCAQQDFNSVFARGAMPTDIEEYHCEYGEKSSPIEILYD
ncbi:MAG: tyrosine--tRNA ligase, partial [Desulfovibrionaceae bacterium]|nr:tyrosine--tRNA ligase [Desulfovibrionaceae bacterium]